MYVFKIYVFQMFKICTHSFAWCFDNRIILDGGGECLTCAVAKTLQFSHQKSGSAIKPFYIYNKLKCMYLKLINCVCVCVCIKSVNTNYNKQYL